MDKFIGISASRRLVFFCVLIAVLGSRVSSFSAEEPQVRINEIMAAAHYAVADEDGEYLDWIELHNSGATAVNLAGWRLTDEESEPAKWTFPAVEIAPGGYLLVFASGKDRAAAGGALHTSFNLDQDGEYLALVRPDGTIEDKLAPFPVQIPDVSYDRLGNFLLHPTPGEANLIDALAIASAPVLSQARGFQAKEFTLTMTSDTEGAVIRYTLDGSTPDATRGEVYRGPLSISRTTVVRAVAIKEPQLPSPVVTRTFLFTADIVKQSLDGSAPKGWPRRWGRDHAVDYGMDPDIVNSPGIRPTLQEDLKTIPSLSLVTDLQGMFSDSQGIYANPQRKGSDWERPMSLEWLDPAGQSGFQVNGGVRIRGGASRDPSNPKHSFHFVFRRQYGAAELEYPVFGASGARRFDKVDLRCAQTNSWHFWIDEKTEFIRDQFSRDTQAAMGHPATRGNFFHLYINGQYWGLYNTQEKPDASYGVAYFGGEEEDYDWIKYDNDGGQTMASDGTFSAWRRLCEMGAKGFASNADYYCVQGLNPDGSRNAGYERLLDLDNLIDYMIVGLYAGAQDNPHGGGGQNNWSGIRHRGGDFGFRFFVHDFEFTLAFKEDNLVEEEPVDVTERFQDPANVNPWHFWQALRLNPEFRMRVADRLQKHFSGNGALTPEACAERFKVRMREIDRAVIGESARWGDANPERKERPFRREDWLAACNEHLLQDYFPARSGIVLQQFQKANLFPAVAAPEFSTQEAAIALGETVEISHPNGTGTIYYTTDGSDPRQIGGAVARSAQVYSGPIAFAQKTRLRARVKDGETWSALTEAEYAIGSDYSGLRVTELHYNPAAIGAIPGEEYEFIELHNAGPAAIDLSEFSFTAGVTFTFASERTLASGAYLVLVRNPARFAEAYPGVSFAGVYTGRLDNAGERLTLATPEGVPVLSMSYGDRAPWPAAADGLGFSIVPTRGRDQSDGDNWRASTHRGGSPGGPDPAAGARSQVVINEILSRPASGLQQVELFNAGPQPADISGWLLTNDLSNPGKFQIPTGTVLAPGGYTVFTTEHFTDSPGLAGVLSFAATGDSVWLIAADATGAPTGHLHGFSFGAAQEDVSFGRWINSKGDEQFPAASSPSFGNENAEPLSPAIQIAEIHYHPTDDGVEWVELRNTRRFPIPLGGWKLDGLGFTFPDGAEIPARGLALVVQGDPTVFRQRYEIAEEVAIFGFAPGTLQNDGEEVVLSQPSDLDPQSFITMERVRYNDKSPWPVWNPGDGYSLQRIVAVRYGDDPQAWLAGKPSPGTDTALQASPRVRLVEPVRGTTFSSPATIHFRADARDADGEIKRVEFLLDGEKVGEAVASPWELSWSGGSDGLHDIVARATDDSGATSESEPISIRIDDPDLGTGLGLRGEYFSGAELSGTPIVRIDPQIDLQWSRKPPIAGLPKGAVSIRWTGQFLARSKGDYSFLVRVRGGVRLWIDDVIQIDEWNESGPIEYGAGVSLESGSIHTIRLEYFDTDGKGAVALFWGEPFSPGVAVIPQHRLYTPEQDLTALGIITPELLPAALQGTVYRTQLRAIRNKEPVLWNWEPLFGSSLPRGLTLQADGVITGIPLQGGEFRFLVRVEENAGAVAEKSFVLRIDDRNQQAKPRVYLTAPAQNASLTGGRVTLAGTAEASAGRQIADVLYALNGGVWKSFATGPRWTVALSREDGLKPGGNIVRVKARDSHGQESTVQTRRFSATVFRSLPVEITGKGSITPGFEGRSRREIGRSYTIHATPAPGWYFAEWAGSDYSAKPTLTFRMEEETNLVAVFRRDLFPERAGTYAGLMSDIEPLDFNTRGAATVTITKQGGFTGSIRVGREHFTIKGKFNSEGGYNGRLIGSDDTPYDISLWLQAPPEAAQLIVFLSWGDNEEVYFGSFGALGRAAYHPKRQPFPNPGQFTLVLPHGEAPAPQGDGYGIVRVDLAGRLTVVGELADGTPWSAAVPVTEAGGAPVHIPLYEDEGTLSGMLSFPSEKGADEWVWIKPRRPADIHFPDGFATAIAARLSSYSPPPAGTRAIQLTLGECTLSGGNLTGPITEIGTLSDQNVFSFAAPQQQQITLQIDPLTGQAFGSFTHPETGASTPLKGVVEQGEATIRGYFLGEGASGLLDVHAKPESP